VNSGLSKFVRQEWLNRAKASIDGLSAAMVVALLWRQYPLWGNHLDALFLAAQGLSRVKTLSFMEVRRQRLWRLFPSWRRCIWNPALDMRWWRLVGCVLARGGK
jgi:hypothetical protein